MAVDIISRPVGAFDLRALNISIFQLGVAGRLRLLIQIFSMMYTDVQKDEVSSQARVTITICAQQIVRLGRRDSGTMDC